MVRRPRQLFEVTLILTACEKGAAPFLLNSQFSSARYFSFRQRWPAKFRAAHAYLLLAARASR